MQRLDDDGELSPKWESGIACSRAQVTSLKRRQKERESRRMKEGGANFSWPGPNCCTHELPTAVAVSTRPAAQTGPMSVSSWMWEGHFRDCWQLPVVGKGQTILLSRIATGKLSLLQYMDSHPHLVEIFWLNSVRHKKLIPESRRGLRTGVPDGERCEKVMGQSKNDWDSLYQCMNLLNNFKLKSRDSF